MSRLVIEAWQASSQPQESGAYQAPSDLDLTVKGVEVFVKEASSRLVVLRLCDQEHARDLDEMKMFLADLRAFQWDGWTVRQVEHAGAQGSSTLVHADRQGPLHLDHLTSDCLQAWLSFRCDD